jgi:hypothetical protein
MSAELSVGLAILFSANSRLRHLAERPVLQHTPMVPPTYQKSCEFRISPLFCRYTGCKGIGRYHRPIDSSHRFWLNSK